MHLRRFGTRLAIAVAIAALVLLAHGRHHILALEVGTCAALLVWGALESWHVLRPHRHVTGTHPPKR